MIDPKELRCGNWVKCPKGLAEVKVIDSRTCDILTWPPKGSDWCGKTSDLQTILLTDAVLEACGFEKGKDMAKIASSPTYYRVYSLPYDYNLGFKFKIVRCDHFYYLYYENADCIANRCIGLHFQYLHQLQDLYYALTGKELNIDEEKLKQAL